jgi:hypothetical protein
MKGVMNIFACTVALGQRFGKTGCGIDGGGEGGSDVLPSGGEGQIILGLHCYDYETRVYFIILI